MSEYEKVFSLSDTVVDYVIVASKVAFKSLPVFSSFVVKFMYESLYGFPHNDMLITFMV